MDANRSVFDAAASRVGLHADALHHEVRSDLREAMQEAGAFSAELMARTKRCLLDLAAKSDVVIVTCATLGPAVDETAQEAVAIFRADRALAAAAAKVQGRIAVLCAVESAVEPNRRLFEEYVRDTGTSVEMIHLEPVWSLYRCGDLPGCFNAVAAAADEAYEAGAAVVAFAHPWMAPAADLVRTHNRPLHSAEVALRAVTERSYE
jgi:hypothetical protein